MAKGNRHPPRDAAASDPLPLFPPDVPDKPGSRRNERASTPNVVHGHPWNAREAMPRKTDPTPEDLARKAMARQPTGASGKTVKLSLTVVLSREQAEKLTARAIRAKKNLAALVTEILEAEKG